MLGSPPMHPRSDEIRAHFYSGNYGSALASAGADVVPGSEAFPWILGAMAQGGEGEEASRLLLEGERALHPAAFVRAAFYLVHAASQRGRYGEARWFLGRLVALGRALTDDTSLAHFHLAFGWYRFSTGRLRHARTHADRAVEYATRVGCPYLSFVSQELVGHAHCLTGDARHGVAALRLAHDAARRLERESALPRLVVGMALYRSKAESSAISLGELRALREQLADPSLVASLALEEARRHAVAGDLAAANASLNLASRDVLKVGHRRYHATYLLRRADVDLAAGDASSARMMLESARRWLEKDVDVVIEAEVVQRMLASAAAGTEERRLLQSDLNRLLTRSGLSLSPLPGARLVTGAVGGATASPLNARQVALLRELRSGAITDVQDYSRRFDVAVITACRDLSELSRLGYLQRLGKARATRYLAVRQVST